MGNVDEKQSGIQIFSHVFIRQSEKSENFYSFFFFIESFIKHYIF